MSRSRKAKILFLVTEDWYFLSHRLPIARAALGANMQVVVATNVTNHGDEIRDKGFHLSPIRLRRHSLNPLHEVRTLIQLFRLYRQEQPDLVHHIAIKPVLYGSFIAWLLKIPVTVNALTGLGFVFTSSTWRARLLHPFVCFGLRFFLNRLNGKVIVQNPDDMHALEEMAHVRHEQIKVISGSGVDTNRFLALPEPISTPIVVAMVARMLTDKGVLDLIEAARLLRNQGQSLRILLFGMPDAENPTSISKTQLEAWTTEGVAEWRGFEKDVQRIWKEAHIAVLPSHREGLPKSLLEAAACGRPIITTDTPGCREVVRSNETGLIVPPRDPEALANAIACLAKDQELRTSMGKQGRVFIEESFSERLVIRQTIDLYRDLLGS